MTRAAHTTTRTACRMRPMVGGMREHADAFDSANRLPFMLFVMQ
jgi:hypothetical protein